MRFSATFSAGFSPVFGHAPIGQLARFMSIGRYSFLPLTRFNRGVYVRAVCYLRVSTDDQADGRNGIHAQTDACIAYAARHGAEVVGPFVDLEGVSSVSPLDSREALMEAIAAIGPGDVLVVAKRDRLGRDPIVVAMIEAAVKRTGGRVVSTAGEGTDSDGPTDVLMRRIVDAFAEYERLLIKARTKAALAAKARRGERIGKVPLGYDLVDDGRRSKDGRPLALVGNQAELEAIEAVRELAASGLGYRGIARAMTARKIPTKSGKARWRHSTIERLLDRLGAETAPAPAAPAPDPEPRESPACRPRPRPGPGASAPAAPAAIPSAMSCATTSSSPG
jgi:site-specific DNA recombinase